MADLVKLSMRMNKGNRQNGVPGDKLINCWASSLARFINCYGGHSKECQRPRGPECTCGWDEIKKEVQP